MNDDRQHSASSSSKQEHPLYRFTMLIAVAVLISLGFLTLMRWGIAQPRSGGLPPGQPAPPITAEGWLNGPAPTRESLAGKVVLVEAWATWCLPCRERAPEMVALYEEFHNRGVVFLGLTDAGSDDLDKIRAFLDETGFRWPNGYGAVKTLFQFRIEAVPSTWVIDHTGTVVWNTDSRQSLRQAIEAALAAAENADRASQ